jgi:hypothetical protein
MNDSGIFISTPPFNPDVILVDILGNVITSSGFVVVALEA